MSVQKEVKLNTVYKELKTSNIAIMNKTYTPEMVYIMRNVAKLHGETHNTSQQILEKLPPEKMKGVRKLGIIRRLNEWIETNCSLCSK